MVVVTRPKGREAVRRLPWFPGGAATEPSAHRARAAVLVLALALAACGTDSRIKTRTVDMDVAPNANVDNALAVDLVLVYDSTLIPSFTELASAAWFKNRDQLKLANPTGIEVQSFEVIPGQKGPRYTVSGRGNDALGAFVFAAYDTPGPHRARIDGMPAVLLRLGEKGFAVAPPNP